MKLPYTFGAVRWDIAVDLPDGDYTVGRGADPRGLNEQTSDVATAEADDDRKRTRKGRRKTAQRPEAAE